MVSRISGRLDATNLMVTCTPDVCLTPIGGVDVPIAYTSAGIFDPLRRDATSVFNNKNNDFLLNTRSARITGHEPGVHRGVKVPGYLTYSHAKTASSSVFSEGWAVVRDGDPAWINHPDVGPTEPRRQLAANTTRNFDYACKVLKIDPIDASDALHAAKDAAKVGGAGNCDFDLTTGDIFYQGEHIGNLRD